MNGLLAIAQKHWPEISEETNIFAASPNVTGVIFLMPDDAPVKAWLCGSLDEIPDKPYKSEQIQLDRRFYIPDTNIRAMGYGPTVNVLVVQYAE